MQDRPVVAQSPARPILAPDEPPPVAVHNPGASSRFLLIGDHAGNWIPGGLADLGLPLEERTRHIAWDIGVAALGVRLADELGASFIHQRYSRLVIDCNRRPGAPDSIPEVSDGTAVPANAGLNADDAKVRAEAIQAPYQQAIADEIERRSAAGLATILIALHSFTPIMRGVSRPWQVGILHDAGDSRFARAMIDALAQDEALTVGDNEPYSMNTIDFTIPHHAYPRRLPYAEIEIRQDLLGDPAGIEEWCGRIGRALVQADGAIRAPEAPPGWALEGEALTRRFVFTDFAEAFAVLTRVAAHAEGVDHHPEFTSVWNRVDFRLTSHDAGGVTERDVALARKINELADYAG